MKRSVIRKIGRLLPLGFRERAKRHFLEQSLETVSNRFTLSESGAAIRCTVDDAFSFSAPLARKSDLVHYTASFEGRAEFAALAEAALKRGGVLFDIGAHCGLISTLWCAARAGNQAFCFEPSPVLLQHLFEIRELNGFAERMNITQAAIGETQGTSNMLLDPVGGFVQSRHFDHTMWSAPKSIDVAVETIESASERLGVVPNFIKLDIEGYEYEAIKGSAAFLTAHRPTLFLELHLNYLEERKLSAKSVVDLLRECGYSFFTYGGAELAAADLYGSPLATQHCVAK
jgi:FkbM family methyltransferase